MRGECGKVALRPVGDDGPLVSGRRRLDAPDDVGRIEMRCVCQSSSRTPRRISLIFGLLRTAWASGWFRRPVPEISMPNRAGSATAIRSASSASVGVAQHEQSRATWARAEDGVYRRVRQFDASIRIGHQLGVRGGRAETWTVQRDHGETERRPDAQKRRPRMSGAVVVRRRRRPAVNRDDRGPRIRRLGDQRGHRNAVDVGDARRRCGPLGHASARNRIAPLGVSPPLLTTPTRAPSTWRSPASPRSWVTASCTSPIPWVRPCDSWPP